MIFEAVSVQTSFDLLIDPVHHFSQGVLSGNTGLESMKEKGFSVLTVKKKFTKEDYCQQHILTCRCSTPVKCSSCDKTFKNSIALYFHVKLIDKYCRFCK